MKLTQFNRKVMTNGGKSTKFTAEMNAAFFAVASDTMYQYKIAAVIRESCSNAFDSHKEAGKEDVPFHVVLPNNFNPNLIIEDFGIGLDDDGVRTVFASYFKSTKNDSTNLTGGFGIGAKSVFAYSDTIEIVARKDGMERVYVAFIGGDGIPEVQIFMEEPTDKGNGVRIKVPVQKEDFNKFSSEAEAILSFLPTKPIVTGGVGVFEPLVSDIHEQIESEGYAQFPFRTGSDLYSNHSVYALMNNVMYPIPNTVYSDVEHYNMINIMRNDHSLVLKFEDGSLPPAAPRESLSLNERTKKTIKEELNKVLAEKKAFFEQKIEEFEHPREALAYVRKMFGYDGKLVFKYRGRKVGYYQHRNYKIPKAEYHKASYSFSGNKRKNHVSPISVVDTMNTFSKFVIVYRPKDEKETQVKTHIARYIKMNNCSFDTLFIVLDGCSLNRVQRVKKLMNLSDSEVTIFDNMELKEKVKSVRISSRGLTYDQGKKNENTVYARVVNKDGEIQCIEHVDTSEGNYLSIPMSWVEGRKAITPPSTFGEYQYLIQNSNNGNKIESLGIKTVVEAAKEYADSNPELFEYYDLMTVFDSSGFRGMRNFYDKYLRMSNQKDIVAARDLHKRFRDLDSKIEISDVRCPIMASVFSNYSENKHYREIADKAINNIGEMFSPMIHANVYGDDLTKLVKMIDFCYENGFNDQSQNEEDTTEKEGTTHGIV